MNEELQELMQSNPEWYKDLQYQDVKIYIKDNINSASRSFVAIGYYLKYVRDNQLFKEDGYSGISEFAKAEFGISPAQASKFMSINDRFSVDGNSPILLEQYRNFSSSKLSEMLYLTDEQLDRVTVGATNVEIRELKKSNSFSVPKTETEPKKPYYECAAYLQYQHTSGCKDCFYDKTDCPYDRVGYFEKLKKQEEQPQEHIPLKPVEILGLIMSQPEAHLVFLNKKLGESIEAVGVKAAIKDFMTFHSNRGQKLKTKDGQHEYEHMFYGEYGKPFETVELRWDKSRTLIPADDFMEMYLKYVEFSDTSELDPIETLEADIIQTEPEECFADQCADRGLKFNNWLKANNFSIAQIVSDILCDIPLANDKDPFLSSKVTNRLISSLIIKTDAYYSYLTKELDIEPEPVKSEQPELPILKNNDQRKEFIDAYETWPLWIDTELTGERYYRYDFNNGDSMVVKVYYCKVFDYKSTNLTYEERFRDDWGKEEYYLLEPDKYFKDCETNKSALVDYLKEIQKKGVNK